MSKPRNDRNFDFPLNRYHYKKVFKKEQCIYPWSSQAATHARSLWNLSFANQMHCAKLLNWFAASLASTKRFQVREFKKYLIRLRYIWEGHMFHNIMLDLICLNSILSHLMLPKFFIMYIDTNFKIIYHWKKMHYIRQNNPISTIFEYIQKDINMCIVLCYYAGLNFYFNLSVKDGIAWLFTDRIICNAHLYVRVIIWD